MSPFGVLFIFYLCGCFASFGMFEGIASIEKKHPTPAAYMACLLSWFAFGAMVGIYLHTDYNKKHPEKTDTPTP